MQPTDVMIVSLHALALWRILGVASFITFCLYFLLRKLDTASRLWVCLCVFLSCIFGTVGFLAYVQNVHLVKIEHVAQDITP